MLKVIERYSETLYLITCLTIGFEAPWTVTRQAPLSMQFSKQEYWSTLNKGTTILLYF